MKLYHGTMQTLDLDKEYPALKPTDYYVDVVRHIEAARPNAKPSRSLCRFAADSIVTASYYLTKQIKDTNAQIRVYLVEMNSYHRAPFRLIHEIGKRLQKRQDVTKLIEEYWNPQNSWKFYEYFGPSFRVLSECATASEKDLQEFEFAYDHDFKLSSRL